MTHTFWIPQRLPGLNDLLAAKARDKGAYNRLKSKHQAFIASCIFQAELETLPQGAFLSYELVEPDRKRDPGNVFAGASKLIEDALVRTRVLVDDNWAGVLGYERVTWLVGDEPGVRVTLRGGCK